MHRFESQLLCSDQTTPVPEAFPIAFRKELKAFLASKFHSNSASFAQSCHNGAAREAKFGTNFCPTKVTSPKNECNCPLFCGSGISNTTFTLLGDGAIPVENNKCPRNSRDSRAKRHFSLFNVIPFAERTLKTFDKMAACSCLILCSNQNVIAKHKSMLDIHKQA